jgi:hypothetical protein
MVGSDDNVHVYGLYMQSSSSSGTTGAYESNVTGQTLLDGCGFRADNGAGVTCLGAGTVIHARNCYAHDSVEGFLTINGTFVLHNCVARNNSGRGFRRQGGTVTVQNCLADANAGDDFLGTLGGDYNASSDGTAPGANSITSATFSFESASSGVLDASDTSGAIGGGIDLSADASLPVVLDIFGEAYLDPPSMGINEAGVASNIIYNTIIFGANF